MEREREKHKLYLFTVKVEFFQFKQTRAYQKHITVNGIEISITDNTLISNHTPLKEHLIYF